MAQGMSADVARQRISRAGSNVRRLKGLVFPRNARFLYLAKQDDTEVYWRVSVVRSFGAEGRRV
jgi:hypothetical protein